MIDFLRTETFFTKNKRGRNIKNASLAKIPSILENRSAVNDSVFKATKNQIIASKYKLSVPGREES
jgi:hypothetical protein